MLPDLRYFLIQRQSIKDSRTLIKSSPLVLLGQFKNAKQTIKTNYVVGNGRIYNYLQAFTVDKVYKGPQAPQVNVLTSGVVPLPEPEDPLNVLYTGSIAEGNYLVFLKKVPQTDDYQLNGGWQGLYPIVNGRIISLFGEGKPELDNLKITDIERVIQKYQNGS